jgi:hypothetical protein
MKKTDLTNDTHLRQKLTRVLFILYFLAVFILLVRHEPWADELHVWCIARDLSLSEIFYQMRYEGHFALWHLLVKPFTAGGAIILMNVMSFLLVSASVVLLLSSRMFPWSFKIALMLSCPMLYWFPVIARCYALIPLALCLLAIVYPVRLKRPVVYALALVLLVHTHAYMEGLAGILGVFFAWELLRRSWRLGGRNLRIAAGSLLLIGLGVATAFLQVAPAFDASSVALSATDSVFAAPGLIPLRIWIVLMRLPGCFAELPSLYFGDFPVIVLFYVCLAAAVIQLFLTRRLAGVIFLAGFLWQILFGALLYPIGLQRIYLPFLILVFCFALPIRKKSLRNLNLRQKELLTGMIPVTILALTTWPDAFRNIYFDLTESFSNQWLAARLIESELPADAKIVVFPDTLSAGTFRAYLPDRTFYRCTDGKPFRIFSTPGKTPEKIDSDLLKSYLGSEQEVYLLFQVKAYRYYQLPLDQKTYELGDYVMDAVFVTDPIAFFPAGEDYMVYRMTRK